MCFYIIFNWIGQKKRPQQRILYKAFCFLQDVREIFVGIFGLRDHT